jgi:transcriptional regulator with XRE-family HTH domain
LYRARRAVNNIVPAIPSPLRQLKEASMVRLTDNDEARFYAQIGQKIKAARALSGQSQEDLAEFLGVSFQQIQKYETGKNRIPVDRLAKVANHLRVPMSELLPGKPRAEEKTFVDAAGIVGPRQLHGLVMAWQRIKNRKLRADLLTLIKDLADAE